ncbi:MAG: integrase [Nitrosomonas sp.]|nr:MAG: integrase [Nitrosomonas sp.]
MKLTDPVIKSAKPKDKRYSLPDGNGLLLWVMPTGKKCWRYRYYYHGKEKMLSMGVYPAVSLKKAREELTQFKELLAQEIDPSIYRQEQKQRETIAKENSFESVAHLWLDNWRTSKDEKHVKRVINRFKADIFPVIGNKPTTELTAPSIVMVIKRVESRGAFETARRVLGNIGQVMRYAVAHGLAERNPAADIKPSDMLKPAKKTNYARIDQRELPALLRKIEVYDGQPLTRFALQLMTLTFVRTSELLCARWDEIDGRLWRIHPERMKMETSHIVPLSDQSIVVLERIKEISGGNPLLFPSERGEGKTMSNNTILYALYRMGYHSRMTGHGFRGIASTILHEQGYPHEHIELQLAHTRRNAVSAAYDHAIHLEARAKMMQDWADYLDSLNS